MIDKNIIVKNGKELRMGYTTGSCATAASVAGAVMLLTGDRVPSASITLPNQESVLFHIEDIELNSQSVSCVVVKDAGDDPDATDKARIKATVSLSDSGITVLGGKGVGVVTAVGLQCEVGQPAINPVPMKMIKENIGRVLGQYDYKKGIVVEISVLNGEEIAKKTFNPRLGIVGGISILGTTGIVEPMSEKALVDTIKIMIDKQYIINKENILISPGNYGRDYCKNILNINIDNAVKVSNYIGEALDYIAYKGFKRVLFVGHVGKLVKLAGGVMNTHSSVADCRMEIITAHAALCGATTLAIKQIMECITTDNAIEIIEKEGLTQKVWQSVMDKIKYQIDYRVRNSDGISVEVIMFKTDDSMLSCSNNAHDMKKYFEGE